MFLFTDNKFYVIQILTTIFGLVVGSFLNVVIYRLPRMMNQNLPAKKAFNLCFPHSHCPQCEHKLRIRDNIPLFSYLLLKGRCAHCHLSVSKQYPLVESLSALISWFSLYHYGISFAALMTAIFLWGLLTLTVIDINEQLLPDNITLPLLWLGLIANINHPFTSLESAVTGAIAGYLFLWSVYWIFKLITGKEGMGYGDFKLLAALGAWCGWQALPAIILLSSLMGSITGIFLMIFFGRSRHIPMPFGPWLSAAGIIVFLWWDDLSKVWSLANHLILR